MFSFPSSQKLLESCFLLSVSTRTPFFSKVEGRSWDRVVCATKSINFSLEPSHHSCPRLLKPQLAPDVVRHAGGVLGPSMSTERFSRSRCRCQSTVADFYFALSAVEFFQHSVALLGLSLHNSTVAVDARAECRFPRMVSDFQGVHSDSMDIAMAPLRHAPPV